MSRHNLWPIRWAGYDRVGAGLFGFPASSLGIPLSLARLGSYCLSSDGSPLPLPARTYAYIKRKQKTESIGLENFKSYQTLSSTEIILPSISCATSANSNVWKLRLLTFSCVPHHPVGAPSFASCVIAYSNQIDCGRKGWVNKMPGQPSRPSPHSGCPILCRFCKGWAFTPPTQPHAVPRAEHQSCMKPRQSVREARGIGSAGLKGHKRFLLAEQSVNPPLNFLQPFFSTSTKKNE